MPCPRLFWVVQNMIVPHLLMRDREKQHRCIRFKKAKEKEKANKGARGMPVALGGDEGRDKLRKAAARGKCPVTRRCPNGETRRERSRHHTR